MAVIRTFGNPPDEAVLREASRIITQSGVLAVPTESFYGLAAAVNDAVSIARVKALKRQPEDKPLLVLIADRAQLDTLTRSIPPAAAVLMEAFWPGPLTLTFPIAPALPALLGGRKGTLGVRQPGHVSLRVLLKHTGPMTGTSANRSGEPPAESATAVQSLFGEAIDLILDGGPTAGGLASTVVDTVGSVRIIREGPISRRDISSALHRAGMNLENSDER